MQLTQKIEILQSHPLFRDMPLDTLKKVAKNAAEKIFPAKSYLIEQGTPAHAIYLVYKGLLQIYISTEDGKTIPIRVKEPPYVVGEMNLFDTLATTHVQSLQETHALVLSQDIFKNLIRTYPDFAMQLLTMMNEKLRAANIFAEQYVSQRLKERVLHTIKTLARHFSGHEIPLSQEELANVVGASRSKVTQALDELAKEKVISLSHRKIRLL